MTVSTIKGLALAGLSALALTGCVSLLPETEPVAVYRLSSPEPRQADGEIDRVIVEIERPMAPAGLNGDEIAIQVSDQHLAYMAGARWISPAPSLVQNLVIDTFHSDDTGIDPVRPADAVRGEYELRLDLREFEAAYDQGADSAPVVRVRIAARLIRESGREFIGAQVFSAQVRARENRAGAIIDAFNAASSEAVDELARWTADRTG